MGLPPPKLRDLNSFIEATESQTTEKLEVWEIGVPSTNSLYWSIVLSYLLSSELDDSLKVNNLTSFESQETANRIRRRLSSNSLDFTGTYKRLKNFNPFKNRYVFFYNDKMVELFRTFKFKLNHYANKSNSDTSQWNDEVKLNAAAHVLDCKIDIFLPNESEKRVLLYPTRGRKRMTSKITLFQYKNQTHGSRKESINVFYFAMSAEHAYNLKLSALSFILKKAKLSATDINFLKRLMKDPNAHGKNFLPTLLQSPCFKFMPDLYKSPYIALKLSEAGFETNPVAMDAEHPSAFLLSFTKANTIYIRILYDYAANCRYLFERSVRDANETILDNLQLIHDIFEKDRDGIQLMDCDSNTKQRVLRMQSEFSRFNEYQQNIASVIKDLKHELSEASSTTELLRVRKTVIECILNNYSDFFYYTSQDKSNLTEIYYNYLDYTEYYANIDCFTCLSFFDNIHLLKKLFQMKDEDLYANIESSFLLLIVSGKFFPKFNHRMRCNSEHDETDCERKRNVLSFIPLLFREKLKSDMLSFQSKLKQYNNSPLPQDKIKEKNFRSSLVSLPEIRDELLISRIQKYLKEALNVSFEEDGIKGIFVIERALQVLGESMKPQSTEGCVVSCMLGSRIPYTLKRKLIHIRDDLSHYRDNSVLGRMASEKDPDLFKDLQNELRKIMEAFEIVAFTQYLRLEESLIENSLVQLQTQKLDQNIIKRFLEEKEKRLHDRCASYKQYYNQCITLSLGIINDLINYLNENHGVKHRLCNKTENDHIIGKLKSIEYVFLLMSKLINRECFQSCFSEIQSYREKYQSSPKKIDTLRYDIKCFQIKYMEMITKIFHIENFCNETVENANSEYPKLESFLDCLKKCDIDKSNLKAIIEVIKISYDEAIEAKKELIKYIELGSFDLDEKEEILLKKLIISPESLRKIRKYFKERNKKQALKELDKKWVTKDCLVNKTNKVFEDYATEDGDAKTLLIKIAYQKNLPKNIFSSAKLTDQICDNISKILTKKNQFLLSRIQDMKQILIDENDEIKDAWNWGRSKGIKYHMKFLMRQRFLREMCVRASLEMSFFDCLNILKREEFQNIYEKLNNIFTGINLRNVLSHGHGVLETIGGLLDEDDLPSELINKMLDLIEDAEVITTMQKLIPCSGTLEAEVFKAWIKDNQDEVFSTSIMLIKNCPRWTAYLFLLPLI